MHNFIWIIHAHTRALIPDNWRIHFCLTSCEFMYHIMMILKSSGNWFSFSFSVTSTSCLIPITVLFSPFKLMMEIIKTIRLFFSAFFFFQCRACDFQYPGYYAHNCHFSAVMVWMASEAGHWGLITSHQYVLLILTSSSWLHPLFWMNLMRPIVTVARYYFHRTSIYQHTEDDKNVTFLRLFSNHSGHLICCFCTTGWHSPDNTLIDGCLWLLCSVSLSSGGSR